MPCPNINSPQWKSLVEKVGENNAWREFLKYGDAIYEKQTVDLTVPENVVNTELKSVNILQSDKAKEVFAKGEKNKWNIDRILTELQVPKEQKELLKQYNTANREELITNMLADYSYAIEINIIKNKKTRTEDFESAGVDVYIQNGKYFISGGTDGSADSEITKEEYDNFKRDATTVDDSNSNYYDNLTVPGGTNYTENEIATPAITPSIKGHAQFATDQGIGWFRSDEQKNEIGWTGNWEDGEQITSQFNNKTRRVLEVQSDLFQKGRDRKDLISKKPDGSNDKIERQSDGTWAVVNTQIGIVESGFKTQEEADNWLNPTSKENQFLQLLNKDNNWVTFFVKSIVQDSAKKGYEKVLFPSGKTVGKIEGFDKVEEKIKEFNDKLEKIPKANTIQELKDIVISVGQSGGNLQTEKEWHIKKTKEELNHYLLAQKDTLSTIKFYEETVANVLNKQYGKENIKQVTDEHGSTWNELTIAPTRDAGKVLLSIKTKSTEQIAKGIDKNLIKSEQEIKYTNFIQSLVINKLGDISPNKKLEMSPDDAFKAAKTNFEQAIKNVNDFIGIIKTAETFNALKAKDEKRLTTLLSKFYLQDVSSFEEAVTAKENYENIVNNFNKYREYVVTELAHKGIKIKKGKFEVVQQEDVDNKEQDNTEDVSLSNEEISKERFDRSIFETNPRDTASVRVKALIQTIKQMKYDEKTNTYTPEYELGIPLYANGDDVFLDMLEAGIAMDLSNYTDGSSKLNAFRDELGKRKTARPYLDDLLSKINKYEELGQWDKINDILTVASKAFANETLVLYTLSKMGSQINGVKLVKVIASNRDTIEGQVTRDWLTRHQVSGFYNKSADGKLTPNVDKVESLNRIRLEGKSATGDAQTKKFIEYFNVLGIKFTDKDMQYMAPILHKEFKKGKNFGVVFNDGNLLDNIYNDFKKNIDQPFEGQYGFQNEKREMGILATLYNDANPGLYKPASSKTADGKSKYLYIQPNYVEVVKREFEKGNITSVTNTALAQPNQSFWTKVKNAVYKFVLGYFNGSREQEAGKDGKVRKNFTEKEQVVTMFMKHQENMNDGTYITFTLSDKTTTMETKMTKEFFVDSANTPVGKGEDFIIKNDRIEFTDKLKDKVYNSFVEPEVSRILAAMKHSSKVNVENYSIASKLFYFFPKLNSEPSLENFRKDLYSGKKTIEELNKQYGKSVADVVLAEFDSANNDQIDYLVENKIIEKDKGVYKFPLFNRSYVNKFREASVSNQLLAKLMVMDMQLNYQNAQIKTIQFLKFDPAHAFKAYKGFDKSKSFDALSGEEKVKLVNASWDEFSKRAAALIAPGGQGNWSWKYDGNKKSYNTEKYRAVTLKDVKMNVANYKDVETTDAQEFITMQEHIDYLMSQGKIPGSVWESIHSKIIKAGPGGYYELDPKELNYVFSPAKPVYVNSTNEGDSTGLNRFDYIKSSRFPLIPEHEAGSERDKLRIWMEKNNIQSANFGSGKKLGRPSVSLEVFDKDNNFIEPKDFDKSIQELSRDGLRNQQELPHQKDEIANVSQMNRTLFDGLLKSNFTFSEMKDVTGGELKNVKEAIRAKQFANKAQELSDKLGNVWKSQRGLYELLKQEIQNDTTGSYTENDLKSIELDSDDMFKIPLEVQFKFPKFQGLINSMIDKNVKLKVEGSSFVQVSGVGAKYNFSDLSKGIKSSIIWTDSYAKQFKSGKEVGLKYIGKKNGVVAPAQVLVSQYIRDAKGNLVDLSQFITEKNGVKILDTSKMSQDLFQLVASRIPNQSHVSMLPVEVVGFLPSYMENTIVVPDGITGQMGSDFDVDKLYAYTSKVVESKDKDGNIIYGPVQYKINSISDIDKLSADQLAQAYRDLHWNVLTHIDTFDKITKSVDNPEVGAKKEEREQQLKKYNIDTNEGSNLPLDFMTSITRFTDNKSGKDGVSIFANLISAQADMQDKILTLGAKDSKGDVKPLPIKIKLSKNSLDTVDLLYVGQTGESKSFLGKTRSISDNLNIEFTESVDNAKNQNLREFNWDNKSMGAVGFLSMLTDENEQAVPIEFMMDLTSQSSIKRLLTLIDLKQDSFGTYDSKATLNSIEEIKKDLIDEINKKQLLKPGETAESYFSSPSRNQILDPQTLADMWIVGQAINQKENKRVNESLEGIREDLNTKYKTEVYKSVDDLLLDYYNTQYNALDLYYDVEDKGRELMTILGAVYTYTKGIGSNIFDTKQKLNQLNKLADSSNFIGIQDLAGEVEKDKETGIISIVPKGELGAAIQHSLMVAQDMYLKIFPIASGQNLEAIVTKILENQGVKIDDISKNKYTSTFENIFNSAIDYLYTSPDLELFDNAREIRNRLINGDTSIGKRIIDLKEKPEFAKNGFLKYIEVKPVNNSEAYTIAFKDPFGTNVDVKSVISGFYELAISGDEEIRQLAKDLAVYTYSTGDAGNIGRFIPIDYYLKDKDYAKAIKKIRGTFVDNMADSENREALIDQIVQNYPEEFAKKFNYSSSIGELGDSDNMFKKILKPLLKGADTLEKISKFSFKLGDFLVDEKAKGLADSLQVPLSDSEIEAAKKDGIDVYKVDDKGNPILDSNGKVTPKFKYPPYILIKDSYEGIDYYTSRTADYLYKRTSKALTADGIATYERINILGVGNIKEFEFNNPGLKSVIKNNNVDGIDVDMLSDEPDMSFGLTPEMFEDYSVKPQGTSEPKGQKVKDGIYVNQEGLTKNEQLELFDYLKPFLESQGKKTNKGENAPIMIGLGLRWDYKSNNTNLTPVNVGKNLAGGNTSYAYYDLSINGKPLGQITPRFIELMNKSTGIDISNYDGAIINLYSNGTFIGNHSDLEESATAERYPVVVANIGGSGNIILGTGKDQTKVDLKPGAGYLFGVDGKNRKIQHSTYASEVKGFLPSISIAQEGKTFNEGDYRVSITMRRVMPLETGMPTEPSVISSKKATTTTTSIKPTIDLSREWKGDLESADVYNKTNPKLVNTMRTSAAKPNEHFGNPFSEAGYAGTIKVNSIGEAVIAYKDWLLGTKFQDVKPEQRSWILDQINQGKLDGAKLLYAGKSEARGQGMHPTALAEVVEELRSIKTKASVEISSNSKGLAAALTNPTELAKKKGNLTESYPVRYGNRMYKDVEEGYQDLKSNFSKEGKGPNSTYALMVGLIKAKLQQHPRLTNEITKQGGSDWIKKATHQPTDKNTVWETGGKNWFIEALNEAYTEVSKPIVEETIEEKEQPTTVDYGGKTYLLEGSEEDGFTVYNMSKGEKSKIVADQSLINKINLTHAATLHPEHVVTLTNMQHQPSYYVDFTERVISLAPSNYGKQITSGDIYNRVMLQYKNKSLVPTQDEPVASDLDTTKYEPNYLDINGKKIETFKWNKDKKVAITLTGDQKKAVKLMIDHFTSNPGVPYILKGKAGTGKTTVIRVINEYFKGKSSVIITPTHKAGKNASIVTYGNTQDKYKTYASSYSGYRGAPTESILIFDEVSMLNDADLDKVMKKLKDGQMVIFMGDQRQLPPVKASRTSAFFNSKDGKNVHELTEVMRFDEQGSIFKIADRFAENLKKYDVIKQFPEKLISDKDAVYTVDSSKRLVDAYMHYYRLEGNDPSKVRLIVYGNKTAELYNNQIRNIIYKGDAQFGVINNNDLLTGNAGWSTKNVLQSPMVNSSEYKVVENPKILKRSYDGFSFTGQNITYKEIVSGQFETERNITVIDPSSPENAAIYNHIACNIINMKNLRANDRYESRYNEELNRIEKSGVYSLTTMYAKPSVVDPITKKVEAVDLYTLDQLISVIKKENPELSDDEVLNMVDNETVKQYYKIEPNVSFGYAITTHKSQGSTYKHVLVDEANMSFRDKTRKIEDQNDDFYAYEANQMRYVAFSRPTDTLIIYTKKSIGENLEYNEGDSSKLTEDQPTSNERIDIFSLFQSNMVDDVTDEVFGNSSSRLNVRGILNKIYTSGTPLSKNILDLVGKTGGFGNLKIVVDENLESPGKYLNGVITINPTEAIGSTNNEKLAKQRLHDVIVHELLHHITSDLLNADLSKLTADQRKWVLSLNNLFNTVQDKFLKNPVHREALQNAIDQSKRADGFLSENDKSMYYGLTSSEEFISMLMTDEGFRDLMNNTTYEGNKSILDRFIDILANILKSLGIRVRDESVLKEGITNIVGLIESRKQDNQAEENPALKSISTSKEKMISENFEEILNILNIKSEC